MSTVPVKLLRPENTLRKKSEDRMFAKLFIDDMFEVCKLLGPVSFMSNDDKASVPLDLTAANLQAPILMHIEYKLKLMGQNVFIGPQYKSIPSVYGICEITNTGKTSYSGDTFIRTRSGKYDTYNAYIHVFDVQNLFKSKLIRQKPVLLMETGGAQEEALCFPKILATAVDYFAY